MIFYYIVVRMPLAYLLSFLGFGLNGIWGDVLISHICAVAASAIVSILRLKHQNNSNIFYRRVSFVST